MKTMNGKSMSFGFSAVNAGQRNVVAEPQVIAVSTEGGFRLTPPVTRALGVANGENVMFINNLDGIEAAIANRAAEVVEFCAAQGLELGTPEASIAIHKEFDVWGVAKAIVERDTKGNVKTSPERLSKKDKARFVAQNFDSMLTAAMEQADDEVKEALSREGITVEEQSEILAQFVTPRELPKYKGSKTANAAGLSGTGVALNFTDTNVWKQLKADLGDDADKVNRVYDVDLDNIVDAVISDGYEDVTIKVLVLGAYTDKEPARIGSEE